MIKLPDCFLNSNDDIQLLSVKARWGDILENKVKDFSTLRKRHLLRRVLL